MKKKNRLIIRHKEENLDLLLNLDVHSKTLTKTTLTRGQINQVHRRTIGTRLVTIIKIGHLAK